MQNFTYSKKAGEQGSALIPALMVVSMLAMLGLSLLSAGMSGSKVVTAQSDEYRLTGAVESVGTLAAERLWSGYLRSQGGASGTIHTFRDYLTSIGVAHTPGTTLPGTGDGPDIRTTLGIEGTSGTEFDGVRVDAVRVVRRDEDDATRLYLTVSATTKRGESLVVQPMSRAIQLVYTVEPATFEGFDYGILTNNVNCVFCHTVVDSTDRAYNSDSSMYGSFAKVKVGTLESMMIRTDGRPAIGDWDADSNVAGTIYVRGKAMKQNGAEILSWNAQSLKSCTFDHSGQLVQNEDGNLTPTFLSPAGTPAVAGENLYLNYPTEYADMPDGKLPQHFPPPFPDDGGVDPSTGLPTTVGTGNKIVDPSEFHAEAMHADGTVSGAVVTLHIGDDAIDTVDEYSQAFNPAPGGTHGIVGSANANVILIGTEDHPIHINGTVAIDGDLVISGYVEGTGSILASGNIYVPSDLKYNDGHTYLEGDVPGYPTGPVTFGVSPSGDNNALGLACGGNLMIGDFMAPSGSSGASGSTIITGNPDGGYNFSMAEVGIFNRNEWAHTQPYLPAAGQDHNDPSTWTVPNPKYEEGYVPRYYQFGEDTTIPIFNLGDCWFDASSATWRGAEEALTWDPTMLTMLDPSDTTNPMLYNQTTGEPVAAIVHMTPTEGWLSPEILKHAIDALETAHTNAAHAELGESGQKPLEIDGLLYTNNAIFGVVPRGSTYQGQLSIDGSLVCADLGLLAPGRLNTAGIGTNANVYGSPYAVGLRLNYDKRTKNMIHVTNPYSVTIKRTLWNPSVHAE